MWIQISEGEVSFSQAATQYGEGPEASRGGIIGPISLGSLEPPSLVQVLRQLRPGEVHKPQQIGEWLVLLRLENLNPAVLDSTMRLRLINEQLDEWLTLRVKKLLAGDGVEPLHYHPSHE